MRERYFCVCRIHALAPCSRASESACISSHEEMLTAMLGFLPGAFLTVGRQMSAANSGTMRSLSASAFPAFALARLSSDSTRTDGATPLIVVTDERRSLS